MLRYFNEEEDIDIDVQVGPNKEVEVEAEPEEAIPGAKGDDENDVKGIVNPIAIAKADPQSIPVAAIPRDHGPHNCADCGDAKCEFYVDLADVAKFANINEYTLVDALNAIIEAHIDDGMTGDNLIVCCEADDADWAEKIDAAGGNALILNKKDDNGKFNIDVQVGPNGEESSVSADPQEANPVDAVKRHYDTVNIVQKDNNFFMDVEDVQKCADLNHESAIDTINKIIDVHEGSGMRADNIILVCNEGADLTCSRMLNELDECESNVKLEYANFF